MTKSELRKFFINKRASVADKETLSTLAVKQLISLDQFQRALKIHCYCSFKDEVSTYNLIKHCLKNEKEIFLPAYTKNYFENRLCRSLDELEEDNYGIPTPPAGNPTDNNNFAYDLIVCPGVAFDFSGTRLGYGKGCYDRFLASCPKTALKIGLCFSEQLGNNLPKEPHDIPMDMLVTEKMVYSI